MSSSIERARVWLEQGRADRAEPELRRALVEDPEDSLSHALLAFCLVELDRTEEAIGEAKAAIRCAPDAPFGHHSLAVALENEGRLTEARGAIGEAIRLDPNAADHWAWLGQIELDDRRWAEALNAAERAQRAEADHVGGANVRARALIQLGRGGEADDALRRTLALDPENPASHVNAGWRLLQQANVREAGERFSEALRLAPGHEGARAGLLETLKARNRFYRLMLGFFLWMGRLPRRAVWIVLIGLFVLPRVLRSIAKQVPALQPLLIPVVVALFLFIYLTWIIDPLFDATLFLHPLGRYALTRRERWRAAAVTLCLGAGLLCGVLSWLAGLPPLFFAAILFLSFVIPVSAALGVEGKKRRRLAHAALAALGLFGAGGFTAVALGLQDGGEAWFVVAAPLMLLYFGGIFAIGILANYWALNPRSA